jgi:hypothetical protein
VVLRSATFTVRSHRQNQSFTASLSRYNGCRSVRHLHFEVLIWFSIKPEEELSDTNSDLELCVHSTSSKEGALRFHDRRFHSEEHISPHPQDFEFFPVYVEVIWKHYKLDRLIAREKINKITILRKARSSMIGKQALDALMTRIRPEFLAVDRVVIESAMYAQCEREVRWKGIARVNETMEDI